MMRKGEADEPELVISPVRRRLHLVLLLAVLAPAAAPLAQPAAIWSLAERLGLSPTAIVLIVNGDDLGVSHAANQASITSLNAG